MIVRVIDGATRGELSSMDDTMLSYTAWSTDDLVPPDRAIVRVVRACGILEIWTVPGEGERW